MINEWTIGCKPLRPYTNFRKPTYEILKERVGSFINLALTLGVHQIKLRHQKLREKKTAHKILKDFKNIFK